MVKGGHWNSSYGAWPGPQQTYQYRATPTVVETMKASARSSYPGTSIEKLFDGSYVWSVPGKGRGQWLIVDSEGNLHVKSGRQGPAIGSRITSGGKRSKTKKAYRKKRGTRRR